MSVASNAIQTIENDAFDATKIRRLYQGLAGQTRPIIGEQATQIFAVDFSKTFL